jgi:glycosyltransferase involved in cell wall biosynthesis
MRIAIVAPSPNPFVVGGAENLWWGMLGWLNGPGGHQSDLIKLPVRETSLPDLVAGYEAFTQLDLVSFDKVISTKYPAWMVAHPNHVVFLQHRCRGFYDWYPAAQLGSTEYTGDVPAIRELLAFMQRYRLQRDALPEFFARFRALAARPDAAPEIARHPGPLGRAVIHFLDGIGLAPSAIRRYFAIADTVRRRPDYFPPGVAVEVVHHPTNKAGFHDAGEEYFFTVSRFYPSKRIDLLIEAYRRTDIPLAFRIAGTGDEEARLRAAAAGDPRFDFLGFVRDDELISLYARALAVPFVPADEDFGYIALEAMLAGKPVITTTDAGGPLELVQDGDTGIVARPDADSLAQAFRRVHAERAWAREIGRRGRERAEAITWPALFGRLLDEAPRAWRAARKPRERVTVLNAYGVHPPDNGGRYRIHWLYRALAEHVDVDLVTLGQRGEGAAVEWVSEGYRELRVPRTYAHEEADRRRQPRHDAPVYDIAALQNIRLTPEYLTVLENSLAASRLAVLAHPYMLEALRAVGWTGPVAHESQNCEHVLKSRMLPVEGGKAWPGDREALLDAVEDAERFCCRESALVYACSEDDAQGLLAQYGGRAEDMIVVPNGTDTRAIGFSDAAARGAVRRRMGFGARPIALFLASGHRPNLEAAERLFEIASRMPEVAFAFVGNAAYAFTDRRFPENIWMVGTVSEEERNVWLQVASVALNPMLYGGGTNLKLLDYFAAGVPVVSTPIGIRGTGAQGGVHLAVAEIGDLEVAIHDVLADPDRAHAMALAARRLVEERFDWRALGARLYTEMVARKLL